MDNSPSQRSIGKWVLLSIGALLILGIYLGLGRGYGKVSSGSYKIATALYGACLSKNEERLSKISRLLDDNKLIKEPIPDRERVWLISIIETARKGDWEKAAQASKRMMEDQVEY